MALLSCLRNRSRKESGFMTLDTATHHAV